MSAKSCGVTIHISETLLAEFLHGAIYFVGFRKEIFWNFGGHFLWPLPGGHSCSYTTILLIL